jgi:DNA polymerase V
LQDSRYCVKSLRVAKYGSSRNPNGRPKGTGKFGEPTCTVRVPISMADEIKTYAQNKGYRIPLFENMVSAGTLTPTEADVVETINVMQTMIKNPEDTFCVRVQGESMKNAGIMDGDIVLVDRKEEPRHGKIIVAAVHGEGATVKRLNIQSGQVSLLPENPDFQPITISSSHEMTIWGVVKGVVRTF